MKGKKHAKKLNKMMKEAGIAFEHKKKKKKMMSEREAMRKAKAIKEGR